MDDGRSDKAANEETEFSRQIASQATRKSKARRNPAPGVWFGLGMTGLIGWSIVVPTLLGAVLGNWLDRRFPGSHSWTLALMVAGLVLGCFNALHWVAGEFREMNDEQADRHE